MYKQTHTESTYSLVMRCRYVPWGCHVSSGGDPLEQQNCSTGTTDKTAWHSSPSPWN